MVVAQEKRAMELTSLDTGHEMRSGGWTVMLKDPMSNTDTVSRSISRYICSSLTVILLFKFKLNEHNKRLSVFNLSKCSGHHSSVSFHDHGVG